MSRRYAARTDENQPEIVEALRAHGYQVVILADVGRGFPDLVVAKGGLHWLCEVIAPAKAAKYRRTDGLTPMQVEFHRRWRGPPIISARTVEQALAGVRR